MNSEKFEDLEKYFKRIQEQCVLQSFMSTERSLEKTLFFEKLMSACATHIDLAKKKYQMYEGVENCSDKKTQNNYAKAFFEGYRSSYAESLWVEHPLVNEKIVFFDSDNKGNPYIDFQQKITQNFYDDEFFYSIDDIFVLFTQISKILETKCSFSVLQNNLRKLFCSYNLAL